MALRLRRFDALALDPGERERVMARCHQVAQAFFPDVPIAYLERGYFDGGLAASRGCLLEDEAGELHGFQLLASRPRDLGDDRFMVLRSAVCKSRGLSGHARSFDSFGPLELARQAMAARWGGRAPWLVAASESPVTYYRLASFFPEMVPPPNPDRVPAAAAVATLRALGEACGYELLDGGLVCRAHAASLLSDEERRSWLARTEPAVRRYVSDCPEFGRGRSLLVGVSLGPRALGRLPWEALRSTLSRSRRRRGSHLGR